MPVEMKIDTDFLLSYGYSQADVDDANKLATLPDIEQILLTLGSKRLVMAGGDVSATREDDGTFRLWFFGNKAPEAVTPDQMLSIVACEMMDTGYVVED